MRLIGGLVLFVATMATIWWAGLPVLAGLLTVVCGLAGIAYRFARQPRPDVAADRGRHEVERYQSPGGPYS
jgi:hypothetical protein